MEKVKKAIEQWKNGLITKEELDAKLNEGCAPIHGAFDVNKSSFIGYDYKAQKWFEEQF